MEKFFCAVCKTIRSDRRISFLRNLFCTMDANSPRSARQTDNSFFYFYFFPIPTSRATRFSPGNVVPAGTGCNKKYADGNKKMATTPLSGGTESGLFVQQQGQHPGQGRRPPVRRRWWRHDSLAHLDAAAHTEPNLVDPLDPLARPERPSPTCSSAWRSSSDTASCTTAGPRSAASRSVR